MRAIVECCPIQPLRVGWLHFIGVVMNGTDEPKKEVAERNLQIMGRDEAIARPIKSLKQRLTGRSPSWGHSVCGWFEWMADQTSPFKWRDPSLSCIKVQYIHIPRHLVDTTGSSVGFGEFNY